MNKWILLSIGILPIVLYLLSKFIIRREVKAHKGDFVFVWNYVARERRWEQYDISYLHKQIGVYIHTDMALDKPYAVASKEEFAKYMRGETYKVKYYDHMSKVPVKLLPILLRKFQLESAWDGVQLDEDTAKLKRGDRVLQRAVITNRYQSLESASENIPVYLHTIERAEKPIVCVPASESDRFYAGKPTKQVTSDTAYRLIDEQQEIIREWEILDSKINRYVRI